MQCEKGRAGFACRGSGTVSYLHTHEYIASNMEQNKNNNRQANKTAKYKLRLILSLQYCSTHPPPPSCPAIWSPVKNTYTPPPQKRKEKKKRDRQREKEGGGDICVCVWVSCQRVVLHFCLTLLLDFVLFCRYWNSCFTGVTVVM